jgi:hypothetical protein
MGGHLAGGQLDPERVQAGLTATDPKASYDLAKCYELGATPETVREAENEAARLIRANARLFVEIANEVQRRGYWTNDPAVHRRLRARA